MCVRESGMKLVTDKCAFRLKEIQFLGNTITSEGLTPMKKNIFENFINFLARNNFNQTIQQLFYL